MTTWTRRTALLTLGAATAACAALPETMPVPQLVELDRFSVQVRGKGSDLVFIPGLASSRETWKRSAERLQSRYRLHLVQIAGFAGETGRANSSGPVLIPTAESIAAYITGAKIAPTAVIGHSLGGTIALWLAQNRPEAVSRVMLVDSLPYFAEVMGIPPAGVAQMQAMLDSGRIQPQSPAQVEMQVRSMATSAESQATILDWSRASDQNIVARAFLENTLIDQRPGLGSVRKPVTIAHADHLPPGAPKVDMDAVYARAFGPIPDKRIISIPNALHFVMLDNPAAFDAALDAFLSS